MDAIFFSWMMICVVAGNALSFWMKAILFKNGYSVNWFWHFYDFPLFIQLISETKDPVRRRKYKRVFGSALIVLVVFIGSVVVYAISGV